METLLVLLGFLFGAVLYVFKRKSDVAEIRAKLAQQKARDAILKEEQLLLENAISELDANIEKMKQKKAKDDMAEKYKPLAARAKDAKKRYKKK